MQEPGDLADLIQHVIDTEGLTQSEIARRSGLPITTISSWRRRERGTIGRGPNPERLRKLAVGLGVSEREVFEAAGRSLPFGSDEADERTVLHMYRELNAEQRATVAAMIRGLREATQRRGRRRGNRDRDERQREEPAADDRHADTARHDEI